MAEKTNPQTPEAKSLLKELKKIPLAKKGMSPDELRRICVDTMRLQLTFLWTPDRDWSYVIERGNIRVDIKKGTLYGGFPYVTKGSGNLYRTAEICREDTAVLPMDLVAPTAKIFGNACSGAASIAWARAISSVTRFGYTRHMTQKSGYLPIGPYTYPKDLEQFVKPEIDKVWDPSIPEYTPSEITKENGEETMYESYACLLPADGIVSKTHVRMVSAVPVVVRDENGKILPEESFVCALDQTFKKKPPEVEPPVRFQGGVDVSYSFKTLFDTGYIPFTFAEFHGKAEVQEAESALVGGDSSSPLLPKGARIVSNKPISDVIYTLSDESGILCTHKVQNDDFIIKEMETQDFPEDKFLSAAQQKKAVFTVTLQLYNGEKPVIYQKEIQEIE